MWKIFVVTVLGLCAVKLTAFAEPRLAPTPTPKGDVVFMSVLDLHQHPSGGSQKPQLRHGIPANSDDWPASLYATFDSDEGLAACTAALVGPRALLTAAHCAPSAGRMSFKLAGKPYTADCERNPAYPADLSADWALCEVTPAVITPNRSEFETIEMVPLGALMKVSLMLGGYGCTSDKVAATNSQRSYDIGENAVADTSISADRQYSSDLYSPAQKNNLFTEPWGANICPGDSGGPVFRVTRATGGPYQHRVITAVNSRVFYADDSRTTWGASILVATGGPDFGAWALMWAKSRQILVCGVTPGPVAGCRQ